jgi:CheY-like chemotaxis protein
VESTPGEGSLFWFDLATDVAPAALQEIGESRPAPLPPAPTGASARTLLYIEDNPANLKLVEQLIARRPDLRLLAAADAEEGIALARERQPEVILMDINLPGMNGTQAMLVLRQDPLTAHIPVVAISANAMPGDIRKGLESGFLRYLTKPIRMRKFTEALQVALDYAREHPAPGRDAPPP